MTSNERIASLEELRRVLSAWPDEAAVFRPSIDWNVSDSATRPSLTAGDLRSVLDELERLRRIVSQVGPDRLKAYEEDAGRAPETGACHTCRICGGEVDLSNPVKPSVKIGAGAPLKANVGGWLCECGVFNQAHSLPCTECGRSPVKTGEKP